MTPVHAPLFRWHRADNERCKEGATQGNHSARTRACLEAGESADDDAAAAVTEPQVVIVHRPLKEQEEQPIKSRFLVQRNPPLDSSLGPRLPQQNLCIGNKGPCEGVSKVGAQRQKVNVKLCPVHSRDPKGAEPIQVQLEETLRRQDQLHDRVAMHDKTV